MAGTGDRSRLFQLSEANQTLPGLTMLLEDIRPMVEEARDLQRQLRMIKAVGHDDFGVLIMAEDYRTCKRRFAEVAATINESIATIVNIGCHLQSVELGIVDFPGILNGRPVLYCWRIGEEEVGHYHFWNESFAARRRVLSDDIDNLHCESS